jgi:CheY-like chemotaxis protein
VRDTGIGISEEMLPRVFELFTQADRSLERAQGGLGIGLALVKRVVELHGGTVTALSEGPGKGSEFVIRLPTLQAREQPVREGAGSGVGASWQSPPRRVVIVDDNVDAAESLAELLRLWGHEVWAVQDGAEALEVVPRARPEVVLLDIGLPGMSGYEVARRLRAQPGLSTVRLIAMTGYTREDYRLRSQEECFDDHLTKPVDPANLQRLLARAETALA